LILEVDVLQGNFKILELLPQVLIFVLVEKWILPTRSKTVEIGQKTEGILGVNMAQFFCVLPAMLLQCKQSFKPS
jgi:hypothetical protein